MAWGVLVVGGCWGGGRGDWGGGPLVHILSGLQALAVPFLCHSQVLEPSPFNQKGDGSTLFFLFFPYVLAGPFPCHPQVLGIASVALAEKG